MAGAWDAGSSMLYLRYMRSASGAPEVAATTGAHERSEKTNLRKQGEGRPARWRDPVPPVAGA
jgi:hypothetical protein